MLFHDDSFVYMGWAAGASLVEKSEGIREALAYLHRRLGSGAFDILDYWPGDHDTIGIAPPGGDEPCVCILTAGKSEGRYDVEHSGKVFRDCVIQGLEWAVRHELRQQRNV